MRMEVRFLIWTKPLPGFCSNTVALNQRFVSFVVEFCGLEFVTRGARLSTVIESVTELFALPAVSEALNVNMQGSSLTLQPNASGVVFILQMPDWLVMPRVE